MIYWFGEFLEMRIVTMHNEKLREQRNYLCPPDRRRPNPLRVYSDKQCSTLVDNVLSRYACRQCCDVQHVGLGCVRSCLWLATSVPLRLRLYVPVRFLMLDLLYMFSRRVRCLGFQPLSACLSNELETKP